MIEDLDLREIDCGDVDWIKLAKSRVQCRAFIIAVTKS
jgi:hypothetical protein